MRKDSEKKGKIASIRLTDEEFEKFTEAAGRKGMSLSNYLRDCAEHQNNVLDPCLLVHMQNVANIAMELIRQYEPKNAKVAEKLESEMKELWKSVN